MASGRVGASDLPASTDARPAMILEADVIDADEDDKMDVDQQPAPFLPPQLATYGPARCRAAASPGAQDQQPQLEVHQALLKPLSRPSGALEDLEQGCGPTEARMASPSGTAESNHGLCQNPNPCGRLVHLGRTGGEAAPTGLAAPAASSGGPPSCGAPRSRSEAAGAASPLLPSAHHHPLNLPTATLSTSQARPPWASTPAMAGAAPQGAPLADAKEATVAGTLPCTASADGPSRCASGSDEGAGQLAAAPPPAAAARTSADALMDEPMRDVCGQVGPGGIAGGSRNPGPAADGRKAADADGSSGTSGLPRAPASASAAAAAVAGAETRGAGGIVARSSLDGMAGPYAVNGAAAADAAAVAPAAPVAAAAAAVRPVCPYMEYDPYMAPRAPLVSYYSYALAEYGDEEEDEEAVQAGWQGDYASEGLDGEEEDAEARGCGMAGSAPPVAPAGHGASGSGDQRPGATAGPQSLREPHTLGRVVRGPCVQSSARRASTAAAAGYGSEGMYGSEDLNDIDIDVEDSEEGEEEEEGVLAAGIAQGGGDVAAAYGGAWVQPHGGGGAGGAAAWRPPVRPSHGSAQRPVPPRHARYRDTRSEGLSQRVGGAVASLAPQAGSSRGAGGSGTAAGAGPSSAGGAGPSNAGGAGPSNAGGPGGSADGCWSLQYSLAPEFVFEDPWSEDEEEETDTTAEQFYTAAHPKDIQGIAWESLHFNRAAYRETRLRQYRNYTNVLPDNNGGAYRAELAPLCAAPRRCGTAGVTAGTEAGGAPVLARGPAFFSFVRNSRAVQSNIVHFQLRNLVWATSPNDVFVVHDNCVNHWCPAARTITEVLNLSGSGGGGGGAGGGGEGGIRRGGDESSRIQALGRVQVSTLCVSGDLVAAGGFMGELVVKRLSGGGVPGAPGADTGAAAGLQGRLAPAAAAGGDAAAAAAAAGTRGGVQARGGAAAAAVAAQRPAAAQARSGKAGGGGGSLLYCGRITSSDNGITNGLEIFNDRAHGTVIMSANNDQKLRLFAAAAGEGTLRPLAQWPFDWAVNYATVRPDSHMAAVVGDDSDTLLTDVHNGTVVARLHGHQDFSFAAAWHPGGVLLATGNQDTTTLLWDVRKTKEPLTRLAGRMGAIRSLRFTADGRFLAMSEPADFVHVYDVASGFQDCQEHDFFGEIAGIAFTPDSSSLFVGISDLTYASLMHLERQRCDWGFAA